MKLSTKPKSATVRMPTKPSFGIRVVRIKGMIQPTRVYR